MKYHLKNSKIPELIIKHLTSVCTDEEKETLERWRKDAKNEKLYRNIAREIKQGGHYQIYQSIDTDTPWDKIEKYVVKTKVRRLKFALKYAAAVLLPVLLASYLFIRFNDVEEITTIEQFSQKYQPGSSKAHLINEKGEIFVLENMQNKSITDSAISIQNTGQSIVYSPLAQKPEEEARKEEYHRIIIPTTGEYFVELLDGTKIWVNSESEIKYPKHLVADQRIVELKGEAYFEVAHNPDKPFFVKTDEGIIRVLGTKFNVQAYEGEYNITTLVEGGVSLQHRYDDNSLVNLKPGEQAKIISVNHKIRVNKVNTYNFTAWKDKRFVFEKEPLESIFKKLSRWYGAEFRILDEKAKNIRITADIRRFNELTVILDFIEGVSKTSIAFEIEDEILYVSVKN